MPEPEKSRRAWEVTSQPGGTHYATILEKLSADTRNTAQKNLADTQKGLAEAQTAQACVATVAQAKTANIDVTLPKVCEKYVQKVRQESK